MANQPTKGQTKPTHWVYDGPALKVPPGVRIRPKKRADAMDMVLNGKIALTEAVEQDVKGGVQLALVIEDAIRVTISA